MDIRPATQFLAYTVQPNHVFLSKFVNDGKQYLVLGFLPSGFSVQEKTFQFEYCMGTFFSAYPSKHHIRLTSETLIRKLRQQEFSDITINVEVQDSSWGFLSAWIVG